MKSEYTNEVFFTVVQEVINNSPEFTVYYNNQTENAKYKIASFVKFINAVDYINYLVFTAKQKENSDFIKRLLPEDPYPKQELNYENIDIDEFLKEVGEEHNKKMNQNQNQKKKQTFVDSESYKSDIMDLYGPGLEAHLESGGTEDSFWGALD